MKLREPVSAIIGCAAFLGVNAGATYALQQSLIVVRALGAYAHWAAILLVVPFVAGAMLQVLKMPYTVAGIPLSSIAAGFLLYPAYRDRFWAEPPHVIAVFLYAVVISGIGFIPKLGLTSAIRRIASQKNSPEAARSELEQQAEVLESRQDEEQSSDMEQVPRPLPALLASPRYAGLLATVQVVLAFLSLLLSTVSIIVLGSR